jgi:glucosyl-dolichyl phosphate glucuronosyltransferase
MTVDAIVCTKDRPRELERCLQSLNAQTEKPRRVVVVHAASSAPAPPLRTDLEVEELRCEAGLARQRNAGLRVATGEAVAFFDDDVELESGYLEAVTRFFGQRPSCVGVCGNITNDRVRPLPARWFRILFGMADDDGRLHPSGDAAYLRHPARPTRVDVVSGANMVFRRSAIDGLAFDERLKGYGYMEDVDFSLRVSDLGELWTIPDARLVHHHTPTARVPSRAYHELVFVNSGVLFAKHQAARGLRSAAFVRRIVGRAVAYAILAAWRRSADPLTGTIRGLRRLPRALREARGDDA